MRQLAAHARGPSGRRAGRTVEARPVDCRSGGVRRATGRGGVLFVTLRCRAASSRRLVCPPAASSAPHPPPALSLCVWQVNQTQHGRSVGGEVAGRTGRGARRRSGKRHRTAPHRPLAAAQRLGDARSAVVRRAVGAGGIVGEVRPVGWRSFGVQRAAGHRVRSFSIAAIDWQPHTPERRRRAVGRLPNTAQYARGRPTAFAWASE